MRTGTRDNRFLGHPSSLSTVFSIELWERFSYYGLVALLMGYMSTSPAHGGLGIPSTLAMGLVGVFQTLPYLSPALWGWMADRIIGREKTLFICAFIVAAGHIVLGCTQGSTALGVGLVLVGFGSGGVKTATQSAISSLYRKDDERIAAGFSLYYLGINIGALLGPVTVGVFHKRWGWHAAFSVAAVGMLVGIACYLGGRKNLPEAVRIPTNPLPHKEKIIKSTIAFAIAGAIALFFMSGLVPLERIALVGCIMVTCIAIGLFIYLYTNPKIDSKHEKSRLIAYIPIFVISTIAAGLQQQEANVLQDIFNTKTNHSLGHYHVPNEWFQFFNPFYILIFTPLLARLWMKLGRKGPNEITKIAIGVVTMGVGFMGLSFFRDTVPLAAIIAVIFIMTLAELLIFPTTMALTGILAPQAFPTQMVNFFLLVFSIGSALSGVLSRLYDKEHPFWYFMISGIVVITAGLFFSVIARRLNAFINQHVPHATV